jgi:hypothetical protein
MTIEKTIASIAKLHGGEREQIAKHAEYAAFLERKKPIATVRTPGGNLAPDYTKPGVAEQVRTEVDEIEDLCYRKGNR